MLNKKLWLVLSLIIIVFSLGGWLLFTNYLRPQYALEQLLPNNYIFSLQLSLDRFSMSEIQKKTLLENKLYNKVYQTAQSQLSELEKNFTETELTIIKNSDNLLFYYQNPEDIGLIMRLPDDVSEKTIMEQSWNDLTFEVIKKDILIIASRPETLEKIISKKPVDFKIPYLSLAISPWLKINFNQDFWTESFPADYLLTDLQNIFKPLQNSENSLYSLSFDIDAEAVNFQLKPNKAEIDQEQTSHLSTYLNYLLPEPDLVIGLSDINQLEKELTENKFLKTYWQKLDEKTWTLAQLSLSQAVKNLSGPVLLAIKGQSWQIITNKNNKSPLEDYLKSFLAQFYPETRIITLPDNSQAKELMAVTDNIKFQEKEINGWQASYFGAYAEELGIAGQNEFIIITNQLSSLNTLQAFNLSCSYSTDLADPALTSFFSLSPRAFSQYLNSDLALIKRFSLINSQNNNISGCITY